MSIRARGGRTERLISLDDVLGAGLRIADAEGLDALSMRRVADALGVSAMTLYRYVQSKEDLLDGIANLVLSSMPADHPERATWQERLARVAHQMHDALREHPGVAQILASRQEPIPALDRWRETLLAILLNSGFEPTHAVKIVSALAAYTAGFAHIEAYRSGTERDAEATRLRRLPRDEFPLLSEHANAYAGHVSQGAFITGLNAFINGLNPADDTKT
jgi:AcrR family transcriptional regulator